MSSEDSPSDFPKEIPSGIRPPPNSKITEDYKGNSKDNSICISDKQSEDLFTLLNELKVITNNRFTEMDGKFTEMNGKFTEMNDKFTEMNGKFTEMNGKFTEMNGKLDNLNLKVDNLGEKFDSLNNTMDKGFTNLGNKLDTLIRIFENKK